MCWTRSPGAKPSALLSTTSPIAPPSIGSPSCERRNIAFHVVHPAAHVGVDRQPAVAHADHAVAERRQRDLLQLEIVGGRHALAGGSSDARRGPYLFLLLLAHSGRRGSKKDPAAKGTRRRVQSASARREAQPSTALAVGALEAAIEHARAHLALVLALEQGAAAAFVAPALAAPASAEQSRITRSPSTLVDVRAAQRMVDAAAFGVGLGQDEAVAGRAVDGADMLVVAADHFHMLADLAEQAALLSAGVRASRRNRPRTATDVSRRYSS